MMTGKRFVLFVIACLVLHGQVVRADIWQDLASYKMGGESKAPEQLEKLVQESSPDKYPQIEAKLIAVVTSKAATPAGKRYACRMLQRVGSEAAVPALAGLLCDEDLSHYARLALQRMGKSDSAGKALRDALGKAPDKIKPGIVASLAERRDAKAVAQISTLASSNNADVAGAAFKALGKIGGTECAAVLGRTKAPKALEPVRLDALMTCADGLAAGGKASEAAAIFKKTYAGKNSDVHRVAALRGLIRTDAATASPIVVGLIKGGDSYMRRGAVRLVVMTKSDKLTAAVAGELGKLDPAKQAEIIGILAQRRDRAALASVLPLLDSKNDKVREAAIMAVGTLGDADNVEVLLKQAASGGVGAKAQAAIALMTDSRVDDALAKLIKNKDLRMEAIKAIGARSSASALSGMLALVKDKDAEVRRAAWTALSQIAPEDALDPMMKAVVAIEDEAEKQHALKAVKAFCARVKDKTKRFNVAAKYYGQAKDATKSLILDLASEAATREALALISKAVKSQNKAIRDRAIRSLVAWTDVNAAPTLLDLAKGAADKTDRLLALQGYIRIAGIQWKGRKGDLTKERVSMYKTASGLATRPDEKKLIIGGIGALKNVREIDALKLLDNYLGDPAVKNEAEVAAIEVARALRKSHPKEVAAICKKLMATSKSKHVLQHAKTFYNETKDK